MKGNGALRMGGLWWQFWQMAITAATSHGKSPRFGAEQASGSPCPSVAPLASMSPASEGGLGAGGLLELHAAPIDHAKNVKDESRSADTMRPSHSTDTAR